MNFVSELRAISSMVEISPMEFYRTIFPLGSLDTRDAFTEGKFTGIACEIFNEKRLNGKQKVQRYSITDDLKELEELLLSDNFVIISPIAYVGKARKTDNARLMFAFAVELDGIRLNDNGEAVGLNDMLYQMENGLLPYPTFLVASGNGLHLYYVFDKPLVLYRNVKESLTRFKHEFTEKLWNPYVTDYAAPERIQYESAFQGFRLVGGISKDGERTHVFKLSDEAVSIEYLNEFVSDKSKIEIVYQSECTLSDAKEKYPEWYQERIVEGKEKGSWTCKRDLYDWWLERIKSETIVGHRYYCLMCLSIYAIKSGIEFEELEADAFSLLEKFDSMSIEEKNRFTEKDVMDALQVYQDRGYITYPINSIVKTSGIHIEKNKRNYRKQSVHMKRITALRDIDYPDGSWRNKEGRPTKQEIVKEWRRNNPNGRKCECIKDTGLSKPTVIKWWN